MCKKVFNNNKLLIEDSLHIYAIFSFSIVQPIYSLLSENGEFLVAHGFGRLDLIILSITISVGLPSLIVILEFLISLISKKVRRMTHFLIISMLISLFLLLLSNKYTNTGIGIIAPAIIICGLLFGYFTLKLKGLRTYLSVLSISTIIFPTYFLFFSPLKTIIFSRTAEVSLNFTKDRKIDVVLIVFDELNTNSLMDENKKVDSVRFPNFSEFAKESYWFINATAVDISSAYAIPVILTGKKPDGLRRLPTKNDYPDNIISLLKKDYHLNISESFTKFHNSGDFKSIFSKQKAYRVFTDVAVIFLHSITPTSYKHRLPSISHDWKDFFPQIYNKENAKKRRKKKSGPRAREDQVLDFIRGIKNVKKPSFHFLHIMLPHHRYVFSSKGNFYSPYIVMDGLTLNKHNKARQRWKNDQMLVSLAAQRFFLQLGFTDLLLGKIFNALKSEDLYDNALIIVTADHGLSFHAGQSFRPLDKVNFPDILTVPMFVKLPGQTNGQIRNEYVETIDIVATIADIVGIDIPWGSDGKSMIKSDFSDRVRKTVYTHGKSPITYEIKRLITSPWLDKQLKLFGSNTSLEDLVIKGKYDELIGENIDKFIVNNSSNLIFEVDQLSKFEKVDLDSGFVPMYISGRILNSEFNNDFPLNLAFVLNGRIKVVSRTTSVLSKDLEFRVVLPESAIRNGRNKLEIYIIEGNYNKNDLILVKPYELRDSGLSDKKLRRRLLEATNYGVNN